ncbi:MAG: FtsX-like permease family protein [Candidatus Paceibacterota bacterium]|jgi:ABC-type lipoprotein release transport system permease subunit
MKGNTLRVGWFLAKRQIVGSSKATTLLIIFIMLLTYLNLVVVSGILVGTIQGIVNTIQEKYLGDVFISTLKNSRYIERTPEMVSFIKTLPQVENITVRYTESGVIDAKYKEIQKSKEIHDTVATSIAGIVPSEEDMATNLREMITEGEYLADDDYDQVMMGASLFRRYLDIESDIYSVLDDDVVIGSKVMISIGDIKREVTVKGIIQTKVDEIDRRVFFTANQFRNLVGRYDYSANEMMINIKKDTDPIAVKNTIIGAGYGKYAKIQTALDAEPQFVKDMRDTFAMLGNIISSIGLVVAAITVFIVIFINAITRRKFIGILKGIGISNFSIEFSYIIQSVFYAVCGILIGVLIIFLLLKPFFAENPIEYPFGDGILVAEVSGTTIRAMILLIATIVAGYIPARMVVKQNTLDSILGR